MGRDAARRGMATMAGGYLIKLYELANLSSCRDGTLHQHDPRQLPLRQGSPGEDPSKKSTHGSIPKKALQINPVRHLLWRKPPLLRQRWPAPPRVASSLTSCFGFTKGSVSPPPFLPSLSLRNHHGIQALSARRKEERQWLENR